MTTDSRYRRSRFHEVVTESEHSGDSLFPELGLKGITGRLRARKSSVNSRVAQIEQIASNGLQWVWWCGLNAESEALAEAIPDAVEVCGDDTYAEKIAAVQGFIAGDIRVLVSKVKILGFGLNLQHCHQMGFVGLSDSYEQYYQAIRRCWRYGQKHPVDVHIVVSDAERGIVANVQRKEAAADELNRGLVEHMKDFEREEVCA